MLNRIALSSLFLISGLVVACGPEEDGDGDGTGTGGASTGGAASGGAASGGAASGGAPTSGGAPGTGGIATGGSPGAGGDSTTGGAPAAGGEPGTGGVGTGGDPGTGGSPSTESAGCGMPTNDQKGSWFGTSVNGRDYDIHLPDNYDENTAYPVIMLLHGCGSMENNVPMENVAGDQAIIFRGEGSRGDGCWRDDPTGADMDYMDAMLEDIETRYCADTARVFAVGYSSGSWVVNQLSCVRPDTYRGLASVTGGEPPLGDCVDSPVARIFVHDGGDTTNLPQWSRDARDRMISTNMCDMPPATTPYDPNPCVSYNGCDESNPLVWCETSGQGHGRQDGFAPGLFWDFFESLD